eukprot:395409_1
MSTKLTFGLFVLIIVLLWYILYSHTSTYNLVSNNDSLHVTFVDKSESLYDCSIDNWLDDILSKFKPLFAYNSLNKIYFTNTSEIDLESESNAIMFIITESISLSKSYSYWNKLKHGSLYIQKVETINDIINMGRYIELTQWDHAVFWYSKRQNNFTKMYVGSTSCSLCGCIIQKEMQKPNEYSYGPFYETAKNTKTDKITKHEYNILYDNHLIEYFKINKGIFLEIGFGCGMAYGAGESAKIWTVLFNNVHFIEYDGKCIEQHKKEINEANYTVHVGDQADIKFLEQLKSYYFLKHINGVDVIIDDGGHANHQIIKSFTSLWHILNPNGLYFIEDYGESAYDKNYLDSQPITVFGNEKPGTANFFIKNLLYNLFCKISKKSCYDIQYIEARLDICVIRKKK